MLRIFDFVGAGSSRPGSSCPGSYRPGPSRPGFSVVGAILPGVIPPGVFCCWGHPAQGFLLLGPSCSGPSRPGPSRLGSTVVGGYSISCDGKTVYCALITTISCYIPYIVANKLYIVGAGSSRLGFSVVEVILPGSSRPGYLSWGRCQQSHGDKQDKLRTHFYHSGFLIMTLIVNRSPLIVHRSSFIVNR
jgi:hypothetical protein